LRNQAKQTTREKRLAPPRSLQSLAQSSTDTTTEEQHHVERSRVQYLLLDELSHSLLNKKKGNFFADAFITTSWGGAGAASMRSPPVLGTAVAGGRALAVGPGGSLGLSSSSSSAWQPSGPGSGGARKGGGRRPSAPSSSLSDKQYRQMGKKERLLMQGLRRIKGCSKKHMVRALELLGEAEQDGIALTTIHYNAVISILARCRALRETKTIMERMERDGKMFSIVTFNSALHACAKAGDAKYALCLLEMIKERVHLEPDQLTYASAILACAGGGNADTALALMNDMRSLGVPPNAHVYNALANVLFRAGKLHEAESCINDMAQDGIRRDSTTWNIILAIAVEKGEWKRALAITSRMPDLGVSLDGHGFGAAVSAAIALGDWKRALQLLLDWRKAGREVSADTYAGTRFKLGVDNRLLQLLALMSQIV
jgi:pentatricopeptide repeat protein